MAHALFNQDIDIFRATGDGYWTEDHEYVSGGETTVSIKGSLQPYREGSDSFVTEGGWTTQNTIVIYSDTELQAYDQNLDIEGDEVLYKGSRYVCRQLKDYSHAGFLPHWVGLFHKKDDT
ncbi:hypothetical protein [Pseudoalteromonas phage J2-1_QLiu-2017]|nr:hypothetical protein [Pseudoalteromonas phage J2-1_QLiu-2017]